MANTTLAVRTETKTLLDALVVLKRRPAEDILHEAVLALFSAAVIPDRSASTSPDPPPPEPLSQTLADRIRDFVIRKRIQPARDRGDHSIELVVRDVHNEMGLEQKHPAVIAALQSRAFLQNARAKLLSTKGPQQSSAKVFRFELL
jgi:hypothetical protein